MRATATLLLLLCSLAASAAAWELLDPSEWVEALSGGAGVEKWEPPEFCGEMACPPFKTKHSGDNYDVRRYEGGKWIVTTVNNTKFELAYTRGVARLLSYFKGSNDKKESMDVTTPTLAEVQLDKHGKAKSKEYSFSLWLPEDVQKDTPQPTDADVRVVEYPGMEVYVRVFSGFATEGTILDETRGLHRILEDEDEDFSSRVVWAAVYDPPQKLLNRHNEIHVPVARKSSTVAAA